MARRFVAEKALQKHIDRWHYLLGMGKWTVTWQLVEGPIDHSDPVARNDYVVRRSGKRLSHIRFDRASITSDAKAEGAVVHELLHLVDWGIGNDLHKFIYRLEPKMRLVRRRARR